METYPEGATLFVAGDPGDEMFVVVSGGVKLLVPSEDGDMRWRRTGWLARQESNYRISNDAVRPLNSLRRPIDGPNPPFR